MNWIATFVLQLLTILAGVIADVVKEFRRRKNRVSDDNLKLKEELKRTKAELRMLKRKK